MTIVHPLVVQTAAAGALFGAGAGLLLLATGRIAGVAGVAAGLLRPTRGDWAWRALFVVGLLAGGLISAHLMPDAFAWHRTDTGAAVMGAGVLIGLGARIGNGCTSGHGVCGVGRFSLRSVVAVALFTTCGALTHVIARLVGGAW